MKFRAYTRLREGIMEVKPLIYPYSSQWPGYTDDPYAQPKKYHRAIALLDAAGDPQDGADALQLHGVGTKAVYTDTPNPAEHHVDYYICEDFMKEQGDG